MEVESNIELRRRAFISACGAAGLGLTAFPDALWAASDEGRSELTTQMVVHAAGVAGFEFTEADLHQMLEGLRSNLKLYSELRAIRIDQSVPPPLHFNPMVPGQVFSEERRPFQLGAQAEESRPERLEDLAHWPVSRLAQLLKTRQVTATELTGMYLQRIRRLDSKLNAVVTLTEKRAMVQAKNADEEIAKGQYRGPLHGIPWGAKDLLATRGYRTTWGFKSYADQVLDLDATVVERLDNAGAILIAKLATGEIARGDYWLGKQTRNPWKTSEGADGSSAGPASATAAGLVGFAIGTDTLGSIVGPSRTCGITGLRPTFGRVSRHGVMPVCWSLDKVGPMCRTVEDCAVVFDAIAGPDGQDLAVTNWPFNWNGNAAVQGLRVGYLADAFAREDKNLASVDNDQSALEKVRSLGLKPTAISLPEHADMDALQMLLVDEAAAFDELMKNGGIEHFRQDIDDPEDMLMRVARLFPAVEYVQTNRRRMLLMQGMAKVFDKIDVLVAPHSGSPVLGATSLTGHPAVTVPNGFDGDGKPTGIQFIGQLYGESNAMALAKSYQQATGFHLRNPPGFT